MGADWKPGTVAVVTLNGEEFRAMRTGTPSNMGWEVVRPSSRYWVGDENEFGQVTDVRPLVVLDLEGAPWAGPGSIPDLLRDLARRDPYASIAQRGGAANWLADQIEAQTKPPRIPEPGLWGVVRDAAGETWVRLYTHGSIDWHCEALRTSRVWRRIDSPVLIREGVES